jgi:hypothetical protein
MSALPQAHNLTSCVALSYTRGKPGETSYAFAMVVTQLV